MNAWPLAVGRMLAARWRALLQAHPGGSLLLADVLDLAEPLAALAPTVHARLGEGARLVVSQCWVRRAQPPHSWHQDGALHHDFHQPAAPLPLHTAWIALTPCGHDAPGLEWVDAPLAELLPPAALVDDEVRRRFPPAAFRTPGFEPGEGLWFGGGLLHRTHMPAGPLQPRTSIELRFLPAGPVPSRLAGETLAATR